MFYHFHQIPYFKRSQKPSTKADIVIHKYLATETTNDGQTIPTINNESSVNADNDTSNNIDIISKSEKNPFIQPSKLEDTAPAILKPGTTINQSPQALDAKKPASIQSSIYNISNSAVGAGILALPYATAQVGWILAIILFIGCALMTGYEMHINAMTAKIYRPKSSYKVLCDASIPYLSYFADFIIALNTFGACCAYLIIESYGQILFVILVKQRMKYYMIEDYGLEFFFVVFIIPCIYWRKLDAVRHVSFFAMLCYLYITIVVVVYAIIGIDENKHANTTPKGNISVVLTTIELFQGIRSEMYLI